MKKPRILLADDHALLLEAIRRVLAPHYEIVGTVKDGRALVVAALRLKGDLIVSDITMPHLNGIDAAIQIKASLPGTKLLFVSAHSSSAYVTAAFKAGGTGYVLKSAVLEELLDAAQSVLKGRMYISSGLSTELLGRFQHPVTAISRLSKREHETLRLIAQGRAAEEIAQAMNISIKTVSFHRRNIKRKLGLRTTSELTRYIIDLRLIP